jgi:hypothetical protein
VRPSEEFLIEMGRYNEELVRAGALLAAEGLQASSSGGAAAPICDRVTRVGVDLVTPRST